MCESAFIVTNLSERNDSLPFFRLRHVQILPYSHTKFQKTILFDVYRVTKFGVEVPNTRIPSHVKRDFEEFQVPNSRVGVVAV